MARITEGASDYTMENGRQQNYSESLMKNGNCRLIIDSCLKVNEPISDFMEMGKGWDIYHKSDAKKLNKRTCNRATSRLGKSEISAKLRAWLFE
jgi:hypothetical protein